MVKDILCVEKHFTNKDGIAFNILEAIAGAAPAPLPRRYNEPVWTDRQPLIITSQLDIVTLGYFENFQKQQVLQARSLVQQLSAHHKDEQTLHLLNYHLQKIWKLKISAKVKKKAKKTCL